MSSEFCSQKYINSQNGQGRRGPLFRFEGDKLEKTTEKALILSRCKFFGEFLDRDRQNRALIPHNWGVGGGGSRL